MSTAAKTKRTQSRALPWFGADTLVCEQYAALLDDRKHVTVPFCGGLSILSRIIEFGRAQEIVCNDKHHHAINFYRVVSRPETRQQLLAAVEAMPFHSEILRERQFLCSSAGDSFERLVRDFGDCSVAHAVNYFVTAWMGRGGKGGTGGEFKGSLPVRFSASGGASPKRFRSSIDAVDSVWGPVCERCSFLCCDWSELLADAKDHSECGLYCDPPWVDVGGDYVHKFTTEDHHDLWCRLNAFASTKVVVRYGDHKLIRQLYGDERRWRIRTLVSRDQANNGVGELCITNVTEGAR